MKRIFAPVLAFACLIHASEAGPKATQRRIPKQFFSENTVVVSHIDLEAVSSQRLMAAVRAIVPSESLEDSSKGLQQQTAFVDALTDQIKALGITRVSTVSILRDPATMTDMATYILFPVSISASAEQKQEVLAGLQQFAAGMKMKAEAIPGWVVAHREDALPVAPEAISVEDAAFNEALDVNPDHDIAVVFVPTPTMVATFKASLAQSTRKASDDQKAVSAELEVLAESEWYYVSLVLGDSPELLISTRGRSEAKAREFASAWQRALSAARDNIREQMAKELQEARKKFEEKKIPYDEQDYDPQPMVEMIDALRATAEGNRMVIYMDRAELAAFVNGVIKALERLADDIADAIVPFGQ